MSSAGIRPRTDTSALATAAALATVDTETDKIDKAAVDGLAGTADSLAYFTEMLAAHEFNTDVLFCQRAVQTLPTEVGAPVAPGEATAFVLTAGNDTWGAFLPLIGESDLPLAPSGVRYQASAFLVTQTTRLAQLYVVEFVIAADPLVPGDRTTMPYYSTVQTYQAPVRFRMQRAVTAAASGRLWAHLFAPGQNADTLSGYLLLHEYTG